MSTMIATVHGCKQKSARLQADQKCGRNTLLSSSDVTSLSASFPTSLSRRCLQTLHTHGFYYTAHTRACTRHPVDAYIQLIQLTTHSKLVTKSYIDWLINYIPWPSCHPVFDHLIAHQNRGRKAWSSILSHE